jgi:nicotinamide mononucleotide transporter
VKPDEVVHPELMVEYLAAILALLGVGLMVLRQRIGWIMNFCSSGLYLWIFLQSKLYGDAGLQLCFAFMQLWGWFHWKKQDFGQSIHPRLLSFDGRWNSVLCVIGGTFILGVMLLYGTDTDVPWTDAFCTSGSLVAQILQISRYRENWLLWILVNLTYIPLYLYKSLPATALLYAVFMGMAIWGWVQWGQQMRGSAAQLKPLPGRQ